MNSDPLCSCNLHPLFLSQVTACFNSCSCISEGDKDVFGTMTSVWKLFYYSPQKAEALKGIQAVLGFLELKIEKPSRWLSHEHCVKANFKELPPLLQTLSQLYEPSGDAEAYGIYSHMASVNGVSSSYLHQKFCALAHLLMQKKMLTSASFPLCSRVHLII